MRRTPLTTTPRRHLLAERLAWHAGVTGGVDVRAGSCSRTHERCSNQPVRAGAVRRAGGRARQAPAPAARPLRRRRALDARPPRRRVLRLATPRRPRRLVPLHARSQPAADVRRLCPATRRAAPATTVSAPTLIRLTPAHLSPSFLAASCSESGRIDAQLRCSCSSARVVLRASCCVRCVRVLLSTVGVMFAALANSVSLILPRGNKGDNARNNARCT